MTYREFPGSFQFSWYLPEHHAWISPRSRSLGWEDDASTLWLIPWDSNRTADHVTGSSRSRPIDLRYVVDLWRKPTKPTSVKNVLEIQVTNNLYQANKTKRMRLTEKRSQGRLDEVLAVLRQAWTPFTPLPIPEEDSEEWDELMYGDDDTDDERRPWW